MRCDRDIDWWLERIYSAPESAEKGELIDEIEKELEDERKKAEAAMGDI